MQNTQKKLTPHNKIIKSLEEKSPKIYYVLLCLTVMFFLALITKLIIEAGYGYIFTVPFSPTVVGYLKWIHVHFFKSGTTSVSILLGFWGILVGYLIAIILQQTSEEKTNEMHAQVTQDLEKMHKEVKKIVEEAKQLAVITSYESLLENIKKVIEHAKNSEGDLLIMNLTASFGYFMTFDSEQIIVAGNTDTEQKLELKDCPQREIYRKHKILSNLQRQNDRVLYDCSVGLPNTPYKKVKCVTLKANSNDITSAFYKEYLEPSLKNASVQTYKTDSDTTLSSAPKGKLYLVPEHHFDNNGTGSVDIKRKFVNFLLNDQIKKVNSLKENNIEVFELDNIPFQLYVSFTDKEQKSGLCLFMFVNQFTLAKENTQLAAFTTTDESILSSFKIIIDAVTATE